MASHCIPLPDVLKWNLQVTLVAIIKTVLLWRCEQPVLSLQIVSKWQRECGSKRGATRQGQSEKGQNKLNMQLTNSFTTEHYCTLETMGHGFN